MSDNRLTAPQDITATDDTISAKIEARHVLSALATIMAVVPVANAQSISAGAQPPPALSHELFLVLVGAVLGGFLGPLLQMLDNWVGITPGVRQQRANYAVQREIAASLQALIKLETQRPAAPANQG